MPELLKLELTTGIAPQAAKCLVWHSCTTIRPRHAEPFHKYFIVLDFVDAEGETLWKTEVWCRARLGEPAPSYAPAFAVEGKWFLVVGSSQLSSPTKTPSLRSFRCCPPTWDQVFEMFPQVEEHKDRML